MQQLLRLQKISWTLQQIWSSWRKLQELHQVKSTYIWNLIFLQAGGIWLVVASYVIFTYGVIILQICQDAKLSLKIKQVNLKTKQIR